MSRRADAHLRLATPADEASLRRLSAGVAMPGGVAIRFARDPDYFLANTILGDSCEVLVAEAADDGHLLGVVCRARRRVYLGGRASHVAYVGHLRIAPEGRGGSLLARGARWLREHSRPDELHLGVIAAENPRAAGALVGHRPPAGAKVVCLTGLTTCALLVRRVPPRCVAGLRVAAAARGDHARVLDFWAREGGRRELFPVTDPEDFGGVALRGLGGEDLLLAWRGTELVGSVAVWDQSSFKQEIVAAFSPRLRRLAPIYQLLARLVGAPPLTPPGAAIPLACAARLCVAGDDPVVLRALLRAALRRAQVQGQAFLMVGVADGDPIGRVVKRFWHIPYRSALYALAWDHDPARDFVGDRPLYIEIATL
jgi:hypothetical protein